jgi:hypothetical protein
MTDLIGLKLPDSRFLPILSGVHLFDQIFLLALVTITTALLSYRKYEGSTTWPSVRGEIYSAEVVNKSGRRGGGYFLNVTYWYWINGKIYTGHWSTTVDSIAWYGFNRQIRHRPGSFKWETEKILKRYSKGAVVPVYYDPKNPAVSVLERREKTRFGYGPLRLFGC